jgi:hypothetical protein
MVEIEKKLKNGNPKLTFFKVLVHSNVMKGQVF